MEFVTKDQLERARQTPVLEYILAYESGDFRRVGSDYRSNEHPSLAVSERGFYWHSKAFGGKTALDYLTDVRGYGLVDSVCKLLGKRPQELQKSADSMPLAKKITPKAQSPLELKPFVLPPRNINNIRVIAYLQSRGIERPLILTCIKAGSLYESARYHNCVFVGRDERGKARSAFLRGTMGRFIGDAEGSDKRFGFVLPPSNPDSDAVAVFESAIDCLSHHSLCEQGFIEPFDGWRLSLGCTAPVALNNFLECHANVANCFICTDDDEAGRKAADKISKIPNITVSRCLPPAGNDWNEGLLALQKTQRLQNRAHSGAERR